MGNKWVMGMAAVIAVVAVGGIGFAAFSTSAYINGSASSGNIELDFNGAAPYDGVYATCAATGLSNNYVTLTASDLSPGDACAEYFWLINNGTLPVTSEVSAFTYDWGNVCNSEGQLNCLWVTDSLGLNTETGTGGSGTYVIPANGDGVLCYWVDIYFPSGSTLPASLGFEITITGSEGS